MPERPRVYKTEGVILRRRNIGEADSIFTVFSANEGKFDAIARGVRKARSRMRGHLEPLTRSRMLLAQGRTLDVFTQVETINPYRAIRDDLDRSAVALYCAELIDRFTAVHDQDRPLYAHFLDVLDALETGAPASVTRYFEIHLLDRVGYELQLDACAVCAGRLAPEDTLLSASVGGFTCTGCRPGTTGGRVVSLRAMKVLRHIRTATIEEFARLRIDDSLARELEAALGDIVRYVLEQEPRTRKFMDQVASLPPRANQQETGDVVELTPRP
ncbi:MAG TPA: DNA repair protein RecO [Tepidiformaceae bacterium]